MHLILIGPALSFHVIVCCAPSGAWLADRSGCSSLRLDHFQGFLGAIKLYASKPAEMPVTIILYWLRVTMHAVSGTRTKRTNAKGIKKFLLRLYYCSRQVRSSTQSFQ